MSLVHDLDYYWPITLVTLSVVGYFGYYWGKQKLNDYIMRQVMEKLNNNMDEEGVTFVPFKRTQSAMVVFNHGGKQHNVCIPYDRSKGRKMLRKKVWLVRGEENEKIEITHKAGVPYLLSAKDMGGNSIIVTKDNKTISKYNEEEIPNYLEK